MLCTLWYLAMCVASINCFVVWARSLDWEEQMQSGSPVDLDGALKTGVKIPSKFKAGMEEMVAAASGTNMYAKELIFYNTMRDTVNEFMPCAEVLGVFQGAEQHNFCIAMEDLSIEFEGLDAAGLEAGWTMDDALIRASEAAGMHAFFWRSPKLEEPWLVNKAKDHPAVPDGTLIPLWFDGFV